MHFNGFLLSSSQVARAEKKLCGMSCCNCGGFDYSTKEDENNTYYKFEETQVRNFRVSAFKKKDSDWQNA